MAGRVDKHGHLVTLPGQVFPPFQGVPGKLALSSRLSNPYLPPPTRGHADALFSSVPRGP
jgi:hypothetical protein